MIELTTEERQELGLPLDGPVSENSYNQVAHQINSTILQFAGATGFALGMNGEVQWVTPDTITLADAEQVYLNWPRFHGRPYRDVESLNKAVATMLRTAFTNVFSGNSSGYEDTFAKVMTLKLEGDADVEAKWSDWLTDRKNILNEKAAYIATLQEQGKWAA